MSATDLEVQSAHLTDQLAALRIENVREVSPDTLRNTLERSVMARNLADDYLKAVEASLGPIVKKAHEAHRAAVAERDRLKAPAEQVKREAGAIGASCHTELQRRQQEAERQALAERDRLQREADERARKETEAARRAEEDARLEAAAKLEAGGDHAAAGKLLEAPIAVPVVPAAPVFMPPPPQIAPSKTVGAAFVETWGDFEIEDEAALPREYLIPDRVKIRKVVEAMKRERPIPGVRAWSTTTTRRTATK